MKRLFLALLIVTFAPNIVMAGKKNTKKQKKQCVDLFATAQSLESETYNTYDPKYKWVDPRNSDFPFVVEVVKDSTFDRVVEKLTARKEIERINDFSKIHFAGRKFQLIQAFPLDENGREYNETLVLMSKTSGVTLVHDVFELNSGNALRSDGGRGSQFIVYQAGNELFIRIISRGWSETAVVSLILSH